MSDFSYREYSLSKLEEWVSDAIMCSEASPQEVYNTIKKVVQENFDAYQKTTERCRELLSLMNGHQPVGFDLSDYGTSYFDNMSGIGSTDDYIRFNVDPAGNVIDFCGVGITEGYEPSMPPWGHSDLEYGLTNDFLTQDRNSNFPKENTVCNSTDTSSECKSAWNSFWEDDTIKEDKVVKWQLPVEIDAASEEYYVQFPDDLLEAASLKEGDTVEWVDNDDGSYTLRKV